MKTRLVVLDGASATGKSSIARLLLGHVELKLHFVKRYTTRDRRPGDEEEANYVHVSTATFDSMEREGAFIEFRHFKFGMSYGLAKVDIETILGAGQNALAIIDLGNIECVRRHYPDAVGIMVIAPLEELEARLRARGLSEDRVQERLENARTTESYVHLYDYVLVNDHSELQSAVEKLRRILMRELVCE